MSEDIFRKIEGFIIDKISRTRIPSLTIAVTSRDRLVYSNAFGFRNIEDGVPASVKTLYGVGSVTKSLTSLAIMRLQDMGKLDVNDEVEKYVPLKLRPKGKPVKIWHLMTHSSGIPALAYAEALILGITEQSGSWISIARPEDVIAFMSEAEEWSEAEPGSKFFYLNEGYVLLGYIVEKVSGMRYEEFVKKYILEPLGMRRSYFLKEDVERDGELAKPYVIPSDGSPLPSKYPWGIKADGGLISNVEDLARYIRFYLNNGELDGVKVVESGTLNEMLKPRVRYPFGMFGDESYGYGWVITERFHGERLIHHGGSVLVYTAWVGFLPERGLGVALLANGSGYPMSKLGMYVLSMLMGKDPYKDMKIFKLERLLERISGVYTAYKDTMRLRVYVSGEIAYVERKTRYEKMTLPLFFIKEEDNTYIFQTYMNGRLVDVFFRDERDRVTLLFERYKLVKKA